MRLPYINKTKQTVAIAILALLIFIVYFYFQIIPRIINIDKYRRLVVTQTAKNLNAPVEIGESSATMTWNMGIIVHSEYIIIKYFNNAKHINAGPIDVEISLPYIFKHQIRVRRVSIQNPDIVIKRISRSKFDIENLIFAKTKKRIKYKTIFKDTNIILNNYKILLVDQYITPNSSFLISGNNLKISDFDPKQKIKVNAIGKIYSGNRPATTFDIVHYSNFPFNADILKNNIALKGEIKNIYPDMYFSYLNKVAPYYTSFSGIADSDINIGINKRESKTDEILINNRIRDFSVKNIMDNSKTVFKGVTKINISSTIKSKNININEASIKNKDINIILKGRINTKTKHKPQSDLNLTANNSKIESTAIFLPQKNKITSRILEKIKEYKIKGILSAKLNITGNIKDPRIFGYLNYKNLSLTEKSKIVRKSYGSIKFNDKLYHINTYTLIHPGTYIRAFGNIAPKNHRINLSIMTNKMEWKSALKLFVALSDIADFKPNIDKIASISGSGKVNLNISGNIKKPDLKGYLSFIKTNITYPGLPLPLKNLNGEIGLQKQNIDFNNLKAVIAKSHINIDGYIVKDQQNFKKINLHIGGKIHSTDLKKYILRSKVPIEAKGTFPMIVSIKGNSNNWKLLGQIVFNRREYISLKQDLGLPLDKVRILSIKALGNKRKISIKNIELSAGDNAVSATKFINPDKIGFAPIIIAKNILYDIRSKHFSLNDLSLNIVNPLNVQAISGAAAPIQEEPFCTSGNFTGQINSLGDISSPKANGNIVLKNIVIPSMNITINYAYLNLTPTNITLNDSDILFAGTEFKITGTAEKNFKLPITINKINISTQHFDSEEMGKTLKNQSNNNINLPFVIQEGQLQADEFVLGKLKGNDFSSAFTLNADKLFTLSDFTFSSEGGNASGTLTYNLNNKEFAGIFKTKNMIANDLATTFMNLPNEIYGNVDSTSEFKTEGSNPKDLLKNIDGKTDFKITDGHLVRLGSLEYLLLAANTLLSGIGNISLNKIVNLITHEKTGYFKVLEGTVTAKDGVLHTDNIKSKGKNLSLLLKGSLRMSDDYADMLIFGRLRRHVSGKLGPLGSLSINSFISDIPIAGFLPGSPENAGLLDIIPLINQVPVLGIGGRLAQRRYRLFVVRIVGNLYDPSSVRSFRWIKRKYYNTKRNQRRLQNNTLK